MVMVRNELVTALSPYSLYSQLSPIRCLTVQEMNFLVVKSLLHLLFRLQEADGWAADLHFMIGGMAPFYHKLIKRD